jgi:hypothetical protein
MLSEAVDLLIAKQDVPEVWVLFIRVATVWLVISLLSANRFFMQGMKEKKVPVIWNIQTLREIYSKVRCPSLAHEGECGWEWEQLQSLVTPATGDVCGKLHARSPYLLGKQAVWGPTTELNTIEKRILSCSCRVASPDTCVFRPTA